MKKTPEMDTLESKIPEVMEPDEAMPTPTLPIPPDLFRQAMPLEIPQMEFDNSITSIIPDFFYNWKMLRLQRAMERQAMITASQRRMVENTTATMRAIVTFSKELEDRIDEFRFKEKKRAIMLDLLEGKKKERDNKNKLLEIQCANEGLAYQMSLKEWQRESDET